ncbi:MAG: T9SS type A sorting domain-containing protein [Candidatus Aegiribacteria sp.]|nr:T9SS type A sorting domain-containing protein [Candidatus Aegiribacteria sp.]
MQQLLFLSVIVVSLAHGGVQEYFILRGDIYIGPGQDTLLIDEDFTQDGNIIIYGDGVLIVDDAKLTISGHVWAQDQGKAVFRNNAWLHFNQFYVGQYYVFLIGSSEFEASDATVDANGVMHYAQLHDDCIYTAVRTDFPDWTFRKVFDRATLILEDVDHVGDIMVDDSCLVHFTSCDTLMPWLETCDGSIIDIEFPDPDYVEHFEFSESTPGVDGIGFTFIVDQCSRCWWSLESQPGSSVTINNSVIRGSCVRIPGSNTVNIQNIENNSYFSHLLVPLEDRLLEYNNTYVYWWNWYPMENTIFNIDSSIFGELIGRGVSETYATNCVHDGATICLSVTDSAFVSFADGTSLAFISSFERGTMLLTNSSVTPMWPYQSTNIAHDHSAILAVNSYFEYEPYALDTALVMVTSIDGPLSGQIDDSIDITGSAWMDTGEYNPVVFDRYTVSWAENGSSDWTVIVESNSQAYNEIIATWNTSGMNEGEYDLQLTLYSSTEDSLTAPADITLYPLGIEETLGRSNGSYLYYPNPFTAGAAFTYRITENEVVVLRVFDLCGRLVDTVVNETQAAGDHSVTWESSDMSDQDIASGVYLCDFHVGDEFSQTGKFVLYR